MSTAASSQPNEQEQPLNEFQRLTNVFVAPSKTFLDLRNKATWFVPFLLTSLFFAAFSFTIDKKIGFESIVRTRMEHAPEFAQQQLAKLSPEARAAQQKQQVVFARASSLYFGWAILLISGLIVAGVLMAVFNFGMEAGVPFSNSLAIYFYASLPGILRLVLGIIVLLTSTNTDGFNIENPVATNLAAFMNQETAGKFVYSLAGSVDLFALWTVALLGIGFAKGAEKKISTGAAITAVAVCYAVVALGKAAFAAAFS
ncbi:MAG TPA: YIP1 family protein [Candidatus Angelobacter sp.]|nr:YIP1 family protein [Candidatus Angelobacter sp.]